MERPLTRWTIGLPFACDEYYNITGEYLASLVTSRSYNYTSAGIDIVTSIKGWSYVGRVTPGSYMTFGLCLTNVSNIDYGEFSVGGGINGGPFYWANDGKVLVPDVCACNITLPTPSPTMQPTRNISVTVFFFLVFVFIFYFFFCYFAYILML